MEELGLQFPNLTAPYGTPHLQKHLTETAEAMGLTAREEWRRVQAERIDGGHVREVIAQLRRYEGVGQERVLRLAAYLHRFRDCVHYDAYKERGFPIGPGEETRVGGASKRPSLHSASAIEVARSLLETVNPMLALRVLRANGWWKEFWETRIHGASEKDRMNPSPTILEHTHTVQAVCGFHSKKIRQTIDRWRGKDFQKVSISHVRSILESS